MICVYVHWGDDQKCLERGRWSIDPLCYVWILGQHRDCELVAGVFKDVGF